MAFRLRVVAQKKTKKNSLGFHQWCGEKQTLWNGAKGTYAKDTCS